MEKTKPRSHGVQPRRSRAPNRPASAVSAEVRGDAGGPGGARCGDLQHDAEWPGAMWVPPVTKEGEVVRAKYMGSRTKEKNTPSNHNWARMRQVVEICRDTLPTSMEVESPMFVEETGLARGLRSASISVSGSLQDQKSFFLFSGFGVLWLFARISGRDSL